MQREQKEQQSTSRFASAISVMCFCIARFFTVAYSNFSKVLGDRKYSSNDRILLRYGGGGILSLGYVLYVIFFEMALRRNGRTLGQIWKENLGTEMLWVNVQRGLLQILVTIGVIRSSDFLPVLILAGMDFVDRPVVSALLAPLFREKVENVGLKVFTFVGSLVAAGYILLTQPSSELGAWGAGGFWEMLAASALALGAFQVNTGWSWIDIAGIAYRLVFRKVESNETTQRLNDKKILAKAEKRHTALFYQTITGMTGVFLVWILFSRVMPKFDLGDIVPLLGLMSSAFFLMLFDLAARKGNVVTLSMYSIVVPIFGLLGDTLREGHLPDTTNLVVGGILGVVAIVSTFGEYYLSQKKK